MSRSEFLPILIILSCAIYFAWDLRGGCVMMPLFPFVMRRIYLKEAVWYIIQMSLWKDIPISLDFANESPSSLGG